MSFSIQLTQLGYGLEYWKSDHKDFSIVVNHFSFIQQIFMHHLHMYLILYILIWTADYLNSKNIFTFLKSILVTNVPTLAFRF